MSSSPIYEKPTIEFLLVVNEWCAYLEKEHTQGSLYFLQRLQKMMPLLYLKGALLPKVATEDNDDTLEYFVSEIQWQSIHDRLQTLLGENDAYLELYFSGLEAMKEPFAASVAENLADIYQELKNLSMAFLVGSESTMLMALAENIKNFELSWGQKLVNGLRVIHHLVANHSEE